MKAGKISQKILNHHFIVRVQWQLSNYFQYYSQLFCGFLQFVIKFWVKICPEVCFWYWINKTCLGINLWVLLDKNWQLWLEKEVILEEMYEVNHFGGGVGKRREDPDQPHANYLLGRKCLYCKIYLLFYRVSHWYFSFFVIIFKSIYVLW